jgi:hypothetical protein
MKNSIPRFRENIKEASMSDLRVRCYLIHCTIKCFLIYSIAYKPIRGFSDQSHLVEHNEAGKILSLFQAISKA